MVVSIEILSAFRSFWWNAVCNFSGKSDGIQALVSPFNQTKVKKSLVFSMLKLRYGAG